MWLWHVHGDGQWRVHEVIHPCLIVWWSLHHHSVKRTCQEEAKWSYQEQNPCHLLSYSETCRWGGKHENNSLLMLILPKHRGGSSLGGITIVLPGKLAQLPGSKRGGAAVYLPVCRSDSMLDIFLCVCYSFATYMWFAACATFTESGVKPEDVLIWVKNKSGY